MAISSFFQIVCKKYSLGALKKWSKLDLGLINEKYILNTTKGKFILRLSIRTPKQLGFEVALLNHVRPLKKVPQLVSYESNKYISFYNRTPFLIYKYIEGVMPKRVNESLIREIGVFQGKFHILGKSFKLRVKRDYYYDFPPNRVWAFDRNLRRKTPKQFREQFRVVRDTLLSTQLPKNIPLGPIHVDIKPENILIRNGKLAGVLDFDNAYFGPYLVDIGKTIAWFCIKKGKLNKKLFETFLLAYDHTRKLTDVEMKFLDRSILYAVASHIYVDYLKYQEKIIPISYLKMLHKEFYPILLSHI